MDTPTPRARRLNRNAAIAAALLAGAMILVTGSLMTATPEIGDREPQELPRQAAPETPRFLDRPPVPPPVDEDASLVSLLDGSASDPGIVYEPGATIGSPVDPAYYSTPYPATPVAATPDPVAEARERALASGILAGGSPSAATPSRPDTLPFPTAAPAVVATRPRLLAADLQSPGPGGEVPAGTVIHAVLVSAVNSDAPADAVAMVTQDVYDRAMRVVVIPRTSRLIGRPAGTATLGQRRLSLVWDRIVMPNGRTVLLPEMPSQDAAGAGAHPARVDNHTGTVLRNALLLSVVGAGAQLAQPQQSATFGQAPSVGQTLAGAAGAEITHVSAEMIRRGMDIRPTLALPQGTRIQILLTADLALARGR